MPRRRAVYKTDTNHAEIIAAFERLGCSVADLSGAAGDSVRNIGLPDLLVGIAGVDLLCEVKRPEGKVHRDQQGFYGRWRGRPPVVVRTPMDAEHVVQAVRYGLRAAQARQSELAARIIADDVKGDKE
jgi:hypothetical protein